MDLFPPVKNTILIVDDEFINLSAGILRAHYQVKIAKDGAKALELARQEPPDLVLLDLLMPGLDGYAVCRELKAHALTQHVPVIFLTRQTDAQEEELGLQAGAVDYITRPIRPGILLSRVQAHLAAGMASRAIRASNEYLAFEISKSARQLTAMQDITILAMASLSETRDTDTANHLRRTQNYVRLLAQQLRSHPDYAEYLSDDMVSILFRCAPLHDIGKVGIPDRVLLKPGRYTAEEYALMQRHPTLGRDALARAQQVAGHSTLWFNGPVDFFEVAKELVYSHHEKWDGSGYPQGLKGKQIPISARLMAIADVYDALISPRVYKKGMTHDQAQQLIVDGRNTYFAPELVDAFLALGAEFQAVAHRYADSAHELAQKVDFAISAIGEIA